MGVWLSIDEGERLIVQGMKMNDDIGKNDLNDFGLGRKVPPRTLLSHVRVRW